MFCLLSRICIVFLFLNCICVILTVTLVVFLVCRVCVIFLLHVLTFGVIALRLLAQTIILFIGVLVVFLGLGVAFSVFVIRISAEKVILILFVCALVWISAFRTTIRMIIIFFRDRSNRPRFLQRALNELVRLLLVGIEDVIDAQHLVFTPGFLVHNAFFDRAPGVDRVAGVDVAWLKRAFAGSILRMIVQSC
jgi:hypothetical protein